MKRIVKKQTPDNGWAVDLYSTENLEDIPKSIRTKVILLDAADSTEVVTYSAKKRIIDGVGFALDFDTERDRDIRYYYLDCFKWKRGRV